MSLVKQSFLFICFFYVISLHAMVYDNRFFPWYLRSIVGSAKNDYVSYDTDSECDMRCGKKLSHVVPDVFFVLAHHGTDDGDSIGIPEIVGKYDFNNLARAIVELGMPHPFTGTPFDQYIGRDIPYALHAKLEGQGIGIFFAPSLNDYLSFGISAFFMHLFSRINFVLERNTLDLTSEEELRLDLIRIAAQNSLGLHAPKWSKVGFSDIDLFVRVGKTWDYCFKMRHMDIGARLGVMIPTGQRRDINNPASLPFGGNGHWGIYGALDGEFELKEDWKAGIYARVSKRFEKTITDRGVIAGEHPWFGAIVIPFEVDPGLTGVVSPYFCLEDLRDGLGFQGRYTVVLHADDTIKDGRKTDRHPEVLIKQINHTSTWTAEYLTFNLFYDFAKVKVSNWCAPVVSLMWDLPVEFFVADRFSKTSRISLGVQVSF